jgi:hypothetical protein
MIVAIFLAIAGTVAWTILKPRHESTSGKPPITPIIVIKPTADGTSPERDTPGPESPPTIETAAIDKILFTRDDTVATIIASVERAARPETTRMAMPERGDATWLCILGDNDRRLAEFDSNTPAAVKDVLRDDEFEKPPLHASRTMSIYRSIAKDAMEYDQASGDSIVVLLCARTEWDTLDLHW